MPWPNMLLPTTALTLTLFEHMDDVGLNGDTDFMDIEHLNISGATKVADYLGEYIVSHNLLSETN